VGVAGHVT